MRGAKSRPSFILRNFQDATGAIYVTGNAMKLVYPTDVGKAVAVTGTIRLKNSQPYIEIPKK